MPFDIRKVEAEVILQNSGILDWKEDMVYLRAQMTKEQPGSVDTFDGRQEMVDARKLKTQTTLKATAARVKKRELEERKETIENEAVEDVVGKNYNDESYTRGKNLIDVIGKISQTCDARNISLGERTVLAASVVSALGFNINDTNINKTTAWRKGQKVRLQKPKEIRECFICPEKVVVHGWDGKTLTLRGNEKSTRVCVYLSGVDADQEVVGHS